MAPWKTWLAGLVAVGLATVGACAEPDELDAGGGGGGTTATAHDAGGDAAKDAAKSGGSGGSKPDGAPGTGGSGSSGGAAPLGCTSDPECSASPLGNVCDSKTGKCVECLPAKDSCPQGEYCNPATKACAIGCKTDDDCDAGGDAGADAAADAASCALTCDTQSHKCSGCCADADCPLGSLCDLPSSKCVSGCNPQHACPSGQSCCSGQCADLQADPKHCGDCSTSCPAPAHAAAACASGKCGVGACDSGWADCNAQSSDGCEVGTASDVAHCGGCSVVCPAANATPSCTGGACSFACKPGWGDCDFNAATGCEAKVDADVKHCGGCFQACYAYNATPVCASGKCGLASCNPGFGDCDGNPGNGCEVSLTTTTDCGACGKACTPANAFGWCTTGTCQILACNGGYSSCDGDPANGCEVHTGGTDPANCGGCGKVCPPPKACTNGYCF